MPSWVLTASLFMDGCGDTPEQAREAMENVARHLHHHYGGIVTLVLVEDREPERTD